MMKLATTEGVKNLFDLRIMMEASLVRQAATDATHDHLGRLKDALAANEAAIPDSTEFHETDVAFHAVLYEIPGNPLLPSVHRAYTGWPRKHWLEMPRLPDPKRQAAFSGMGGQVAESPAAVGAAAEAVFVMVMNGDLAKEVILDGLVATMAEGSAIILSANIHRVGHGPGDGQTVKACLQSLIGAQFAATFEAAALAAKAGCPVR